MTGGGAYAAADDLVELLQTSWTLSQPVKVKKMWDEKSVGFGEERIDSILVFPKIEEINYFGLYGSDFLHNIDIQIQVRSYQGNEHHNDLVSEFQRIIKENIRRTDYVDLLIRSSVSESEPLRNMFRHTFTVRYRQLNP